eukprot:TRINITY_DN1168_c0_g1_i1.p1 TRINITY_DN1168_c0_g1~~TRINITY_DN1168_c0_g1_i1.p1  ORF type:complete len:476 (-),score=54.20 TRINITY_DN1168_c0_g1_i1:437-1864(-)
MVSFANRWPAELEALPLLPVLPTLTPTSHVLRHLRTVLFGATQNGEHLTTLVARPSTPTETQILSPPKTESKDVTGPMDLLIDGFADNLSHNSLPIPVYAQLSEEEPILKFLPAGDTALTAFPIAAACRLKGTDLEVTFSTRIPDVHFYAFKEQPLHDTEVRLSENSLSILLRTELSNGHGLLEQRRSTTMSVQPVRMRDTTSITRVAGAWYAGSHNEFNAAVSTLGRHLARRRNRRIALSSSPSVDPIVAKAIVLRFGNPVQVRWLYIMARSTFTKWTCKCQGNGAAGVPISFQISEQIPTLSIVGIQKSVLEGKHHLTPRQANSRKETPKSSRRGAQSRRSRVEGSTVLKTSSSVRGTRLVSDESNKEEPFMTEKMTEFKFADEPAAKVGKALPFAALTPSIRIRRIDVDEEATDVSGGASTVQESTSFGLSNTMLSSIYDDDEASIAELCRKYLNVDYNEEVAREVSSQLNE